MNGQPGKRSVNYWGTCKSHALISETGKKRRQSLTTILSGVVTVDQTREQVLGIQRKPGDSGLPW